MRRSTNLVLSWILALVMLVCLGYIGVYFVQRLQSRQLNEELIGLKATATPSSGAQSASAAPQATPQAGDGAQAQTPDPTILPTYQALYERNPDLVAWVKIEGTNIDYPVMYSAEDGEHYLYRNFDGQDDAAGTPFLDERCSLDPRSDNLLVHGHNMKDGSMFHNLRYYKDESFFLEHPIIQFDTLYAEGRYQIIAVLQTRVLSTGEEGFRYYAFIDADSPEAFDDFVQSALELSLYDTGESAQYGDQLLTLSTCDYADDNGRLAVIAKRID